MIEVKKCSKHHIQFVGKVVVNFYPTKNKAYINRTMKAFSCTEKEAKAIAEDPELIHKKQFVKKKRKTNNLNRRKTLYYRKDMTLCHVCGEFMHFDETTLEHIIPLAKGGSDRYDNLALSHERCNQEKGSKVISK